MKKILVEKFKLNVIDKAQVKKIVGGYGGSGCGTVCTTFLDCDKGYSYITCIGVPGKGCSK